MARNSTVSTRIDQCRVKNLSILVFCAVIASSVGRASAQSSRIQDSIEWILPADELTLTGVAERDKIAILGGSFRLVKDSAYRLSAAQWNLPARNDAAEIRLPQILREGLVSIYGLPTNFPLPNADLTWLLDTDEIVLSVCKEDCMIRVERKFNSHEIQRELRDEHESGGSSYTGVTGDHLDNNK